MSVLKRKKRVPKLAPTEARGSGSRQSISNGILPGCLLEISPGFLVDEASQRMPALGVMKLTRLSSSHRRSYITPTEAEHGLLLSH